MTLILIIFCIWGASALVRASKEVKAERERERLRREQAARSAELARMTAEWKQRQAEAKIETARLIAVEREQIRQAKEQERQAVILEKHEKRIELLEYKVRKLDRDIEAQNELLADYYAQLDWLLLQQSGTVSGGSEFAKWQNKIVTKNNQIRKAECKLADMNDAKERAEKEMEVA
jgi:hypothetical protein